MSLRRKSGIGRKSKNSRDEKQEQMCGLSRPNCFKTEPLTPRYIIVKCEPEEDLINVNTTAGVLTISVITHCYIYIPPSSTMVAEGGFFLLTILRICGIIFIDKKIWS